MESGGDDHVKQHLQISPNFTAFISHLNILKLLPGYRMLRAAFRFHFWMMGRQTLAALSSLG
jgi:hypothetical protein